MDIISLFLWSLAESVIFPIPPDPLLMALVLKSPGLGLLLGIITTLGSLCGAALGYLIGVGGGRPLLYRFAKGPKLEKVERLFNKYDLWAIAVAGLTPLPYKLFTLSAGVFELSFTKFLAVSLVSRGLRFITLGLLVSWFGPQMVEWIKEYFDVVTIAGVVIIGLGIYGYHLLKAGTTRD